jgi:rhomboid protease GluP
MYPIKTYLSKTHYKNGLRVAIVFISILFIISDIYWRDFGNISEFLVANGNLVLEKKEWYRCFTSIFIHSDLDHLLSNSYTLFFLVYLNYTYFGPLLFPILSIIFAALINLIALWTYHPQIYLLGASGLAYLLGGCWFALFILLDRRLSLFIRIFKSFAVALIIFFPQTLVVDVSYRAHFFGFILGLLTGIVYFMIKKKHLRRFEEYPEEEIEMEDQSL